VIRCIEVELIIPDNEARTALATLQRLGVGIRTLERADLYRCDVADDAADALVPTLRAIETIFNPNKHAIRLRDSAGPGTGEVWIDERTSQAAPAALPIRIARRAITGLRSFERFTVWRMATAPGVAAEARVVAAATDLLLCNPAFQKATHA
jgi:hypothetical protein